MIGWHFFYEGITKLLTASADLLGRIPGELALAVERLVSRDCGGPHNVEGGDWLNMMGLTLIGVRFGDRFVHAFMALMGMALIGLYYVANPALIGWNYGMPVEGSYFLVDKNLAEFGGLMVLAMFPTAGLQDWTGCCTTSGGEGGGRFNRNLPRLLLRPVRAWRLPMQTTASVGARRSWIWRQSRFWAWRPMAR